MADFPNNIFEWRNMQNLPGISFNEADTKNLYAEDINAIIAEIIAIQTVLGVETNGSYETVRDWLEDLSSGGLGAQWLTGSGAPDNGNGNDGDMYLNTANGDVYKKVSGSWGSPVANIKGATGATGATGADGATGATGADGANGPAGPGLPPGGTTGQIPVKASNDDYDTEWADQPAGGSPGWSLVSYSIALSATSITVPSLDLSTDLRYKIIVEADAVAAIASTFLLEFNGVTTADSYWTAGVGRGYDGTTATNEPFGSKSTSLSFQNVDTNSIQGEFDVSLVTGDATNGRIAVEYKVTGLYSGATEIMNHSSGSGYQNTQTNLTSLKFKVGAGNKNWKVWVFKAATS